ncbi:MAG: hypothetical protein ACREP9_16425, partial [Candidatus Dormibacteraceae bacterium]
MTRNHPASPDLSRRHQHGNRPPAADTTFSPPVSTAGHGLEPSSLHLKKNDHSKPIGESARRTRVGGDRDVVG